MNPEDIENRRLFLIDLDGTIYLGDELIAGATDFLARLRERNLPHYFLTNNSSRSKDDYVARLARLRVDTRREQMILSTDGLIEHLLARGVTEVYLVGTASMERMFADAGIATRSQDPACVVLGYDTELTYEKIASAAVHLQNGVELLASHCDRVCPSPRGPLPDVGSMLSMFETATGVRPTKIFGKPGAEMVAHVLDRHGLNGADAVMVGDRLYTDMALARNVGCAFVLTLSGETRREDLAGLDDPPDLVVENVGELLR